MILIILCLVDIKSYAQIRCGTAPRTASEAQALPFYKNSNWLIKEGRKLGILIPEDYLDKLTEQDVGRSLASYSWAPNENPAKQNSKLNLNELSTTLGRPEGGIPQTSIKYIKVKAFVWTNAAGTRPVSDAGILNTIIGTNQILINNHVPISLFLDCNINVQVSNDYYEMDKDDYDEIASNSGTDDFEIHFVNNIYNGNASGLSKLPSKNIIGNESNDNYCIALSSATADVLAHELGHTLGLDHTHNGGRSGKDSNKDCGDCYQESVSRTMTQGLACLGTIGQKKCEVNGDFFCDTPADPNLFYGNVSNAPSCVYNNLLGTDRWGAPWTPQVRNIMSYSLCGNVFTPQQIIWMLLNLPYFASINNGYTISGTPSLCPNQIGTYTLPAVTGATQYTWSVPVGWAIISGQGSRTCSIKAPSSSAAGTIIVTPNCGAPAIYYGISDNSKISINGSTYACPSQTLTFDVPYVSGATYSWSVYGPQLSSGQGTNLITVLTQPGYTGGSINVSVNYGSCTASASKIIYKNTGCTTGNKIIISDTLTHVNKANISSKREREEENMDIVSRESETFLAYPNPSNGELNINVYQKGNYELHIINVWGREVLLQNIKEGLTTVNVSSLNEGQYVIEIINKRNKLIKNIIITK
jgi:hypothetical protein